MPRESYGIAVNSVKIQVSISPEKQAYEIGIPQIAEGTKALMEQIKGELAAKLTITPAEIIDPRAIEAMRASVKEEAEKLVGKKLPGIDSATKDFLVVSIANSTVGIGDIEFLMADPELEEIVVPGAGANVRVYHKKLGWLKTNISVASESQIQNYSSILARRVGKQITTLSPLLDAHMVTGDRANAVLYPISNSGNTITIRKFAREPWTVVDLVKNRTIDSETAALVWECVQYEMNILVSGGTASGKTSMLNVIMSFMPSNHRILSIEDTRELQLPENLFWTPMTTRLQGVEGRGEVSMIDLLVNALRMRPDRIILGEIRKEKDAEVLFEAMHTGHSVYATVHADTIFETVRRLINPPINVPPNLLEAVNLVIVMFRDRKRGIRRVLQVGELMQSEGREKIMPNVLYRWDSVEDRIVRHSESRRLIDDISRNTGMPLESLEKELLAKKSIIDWMVRNNIRDLRSIAGVVQDYYSDPASVSKRMSAKK